MDNEELDNSDEQENDNIQENNEYSSVSYIGLGICLGVVLDSVLFENRGIGVAVGLCLGVVVGNIVNNN